MRKLRFTVIGLAVLLWLMLCLPLPTYATQVAEDYTAYTETDGSGRFAVNNASCITISGMKQQDMNHYIYRTNTSGYWGEFTHDLAVYMDEIDDNEAPEFMGSVWGLSNIVEDEYHHADNSISSFWLQVRSNAVNLKYNLRLQQYGAATKSHTSSNLDEDTFYYIRIIRSGSNLYCGIYSTSGLRDAGDATDGDVDNLSLSSCYTTRFKTLYAVCSRGQTQGGANEEVVTGYVRHLYVNTYTYEYTLEGLYDETDGTRDGTVDVTVHFSGQSSETVTVDGTFAYTEQTKPQYFEFDLHDNDREYWLDSDEGTGTSIRIFNASTTLYTIQFVDLSGILSTYSFVSARRNVGGTTYTIEKRQTDANHKVVMALLYGGYYDIRIEDSISIDYGTEYFGADTSVELVLTGMEFPPTITEGYKYVRIWAYRDADDATDLIVNYEDLQTETNNVSITYYYTDGTSAYETYSTSDSFISTWSNADENTTYYVVAEIDRDSGPLEYRQTLPRGWGRTNPWTIDFLWDSAPFDTNILIPAFIILCVAGVFSSLNVPVGAFAAVCTAIILWWLWGLSIPEEALLIGMVMAFLLAISYAKRRVQVF